MTELRATVVGWVAGKRVAIEVSGQLYDQIQAFQRAGGLSNDALLDRITQGGTRTPTERAAASVLEEHMGQG